MTTAYTSLLGLALPVSGELSGTWGATVNDFITQYLDASVAGTNTFSSDSDVTLVKTTNASLGSTSSQYAVLLWTAAGTATRTIIAPSASSGGRQFYIVVNQSTTQSIKLCGAGPTTGVTVLPSSATVCAWNGTDFTAVGGGIPSGGIILWSGSIATIPSGWYLCDGTNGTPNLRDRFIVGAGTTYAVAATGGSANAILVSHTHTATVTDPGHFHDIGQSQQVPFGTGGVNNPAKPGPTNSAQSSTVTTGVTVANSTEGVSGTNANLPPYYALAYIMKS